MYATMLIMHFLGATIWTGGHLVLCLTILPRALKARDPKSLLDFESLYEPLGLTGLATQVITGLWLAWRYVPDLSQWFAWQSAVSVYISIKLGLLLLTILIAADARLRVIPSLRPNNVHNLRSFAFHITGVTIIAVLFVVAGVGLRLGGLF